MCLIPKISASTTAAISWLKHIIFVSGEFSTGARSLNIVKLIDRSIYIFLSSIYDVSFEFFLALPLGPDPEENTPASKSLKGYFMKMRQMKSNSANFAVTQIPSLFTFRLLSKIL